MFTTWKLGDLRKQLGSELRTTVVGVVQSAEKRNKRELYRKECERREKLSDETSHTPRDVVCDWSTAQASLSPLIRRVSDFTVALKD